MNATSNLHASMPGYVCDTIPPARISHRPNSRSPSPIPPPTPPVPAFKAPITESSSATDDPLSHIDEHEHALLASQIAPPPGRKLCVRHQRMADEGTNLKLQQVSSVSFRVLWPRCVRGTLATKARGSITPRMYALVTRASQLQASTVTALSCLDVYMTTSPPKAEGCLLWAGSVPGHGVDCREGNVLVPRLRCSLLRARDRPCLSACLSASRPNDSAIYLLRPL